MGTEVNAQVGARFGRDPAAAAAARAFVRETLSSHGVGDDAVDRMVAAAGEACNNAIVHAAGDSFGLHVAVRPGVCTVSVSDLGPGFAVPADPEMPGPDELDHRGLALMNALVDHVKVASSPIGTELMLVQWLVPLGVPQPSARPRHRPRQDAVEGSQAGLRLS